MAFAAGKTAMKHLTLISHLAAVSAPLLATLPADASNVGRRFPSERRVIVDETTGVKITALTTAAANDDKIYQTHPSWTADGKHIVFHSDRADDKGRQIFAVSEENGGIIQLTDAPDVHVGSICLARRSNRAYYYRGRELVELNLDRPLLDGKVESAQAPSVHERVIAALPEGTSLSGTFTLDADERRAHLGVKLPGNDRWGIRTLDLQTGTMRTVIDLKFRVGHCQANPFEPGLIMYCHETGGDAPQRMWLVRADGTGNRPLYVEKPEQWVTHEVWWDRDHVLFVISGHNAKLRIHPYGLASTNVRTGEATIHDQYTYWHCTGPGNRKCAVGDTFGGELYLLDIATGRKRLLSSGNRPPGVQPHAHQSMSPDGKRVLFCSGRLGSNDLMTITLPAFDALKNHPAGKK